MANKNDNNGKVLHTAKGDIQPNFELIKQNSSCVKLIPLDDDWAGHKTKTLYFNIIGVDLLKNKLILFTA